MTETNVLFYMLGTVYLLWTWPSVATITHHSAAMRLHSKGLCVAGAEMFVESSRHYVGF